MTRPASAAASHSFGTTGSGHSPLFQHLHACRLPRPELRPGLRLSLSRRPVRRGRTPDGRPARAPSQPLRDTSRRTWPPHRRPARRRRHAILPAPAEAARRAGRRNGGDPLPRRSAMTAVQLFRPLVVANGEQRHGPGDFSGVQPKQVLELLLAARRRRVPKERSPPPRRARQTVRGAQDRDMSVSHRRTSLPPMSFVWRAPRHSITTKVKVPLATFTTYANLRTQDMT
jgi:hypothetical protein